MRTIPLHGKKAAGRVALVDDADYEMVSALRWYVYEVKREGVRTRGPYALADLGDSTVKMHKLITGWPATDHADHDGLNNQRYNLRPAGARNRLNLGNARPREGYTSRYKGVSRITGREKWRASIGNGPGKSKHLGVFLSEEDAARAYDAAALATWGEYACINFPAA